LPRLLHTVKHFGPAVRDLVPELSKPTVEETPRLGSSEAIDNLTVREAEVLELIAKGLTNAEIASALFITLSTAKVHVRSILRKLGLRTRTEAAIYATTLSRASQAVGGAKAISQI
jgi:DNA-binding NarL/FixJ family response regulator